MFCFEKRKIRVKTWKCRTEEPVVFAGSKSIIPNQIPEEQSAKKGIVK
jgi:hypothetical protein